MIFGNSSSFIEDATEYIEKYKKPINLTFYSDGMSNFISGIIGFSSIKDSSTGNEFWRFKNKGGNDRFYTFNSEVSDKLLREVSLRSVANKARYQNLFTFDEKKNIKQIRPFASRIYPNHYSTFFFNSSQRDGYILRLDENKEYRFNENNGDMEIYMDAILKSSDFYYYFSDSPGKNLTSVGYKGIDVKVVEKNDIPDDAIIIS